MLKPVLVRAWEMINPDEAEKPVTCGEEPAAVQLKLEPVTLDCSGMEAIEAEQMAELLTGLVTAGLGFTVTTTFWDIPGAHPLAEGVAM